MAKACNEYKQWVEERVEKRVDEWVEERRKECKKRKWYDPRGWICWFVTTLVLVVRWVVVWVGKWVTYVVCQVVTFTANFLATFIGLILSIPILGRLLGWLWRIIILELVWRAVSAIMDLGFAIVGTDPEKKLRLCIVILRDAQRVPMATPESLQPAIEDAGRIFRDVANVKLIVGEIHTIDAPAPESNLDPACEPGALWDDLWLPGTYFENNSNVQCFDSALLRLIGFRAPVVVFVVRAIEGKRGCSIGPLVDYVTIEGADPACLAHEVAHSCGLPHYDADQRNLANANCGGTTLLGWQRAWLRASRHVTFL